jgi:ABC-2 type transport system permease protein
METTLDLSRWQEKPQGVRHRRWVIVSTGLRLVLRLRLFRFLIFLGALAGALIAIAGFVFSQSVSSGGWLESLAATFGPRLQAVIAAFNAVVLLYPDVCVHGLFTLIFGLQSFIALWLCLIGLTALIPRLVTQDRASNALTIYLARPLTSADYLIGKLGIVGGLVVILWTAPLLAGWLLSMLLSPNRDFLVYSIRPLGTALLFNAIALVSLAAISLGVSAVSRSSRNTIVLWVALWVVLGVVAAHPNNPPWLRHASFSQDLMEIRESVFRFDTVFTRAADELPLFNKSLAANLHRAAEKTAPIYTRDAAVGLGVLVLLSLSVFFRRLRPE